MSTSRGFRLRQSFRDIERNHFAIRSRSPRASTELERLVLAFKGIQELPPNELNSFFVIGGYHGEPFRGAGWSNPMWWGGYCYHGQILFPTWHRAYLLRLEDALRSIPGCENVTLPFMDWCDDATESDGLPITLTKPTFLTSSGKWIKNPLYSYTFQKGVFDNLSQIPDADYSKTAGYETVRFPLSGLVGDADIATTQEWNKQFAYPKNVAPLNDNVKDWLYSGIDIDTGKKDKDGKPITNFYKTGTYEKFRKCLDAPNYTLFSNNSSAQQYNQETLNRESVPFSSDDVVVVSLEAPHNDMHLSVGGFQVPGAGDRDPSKYNGANGDMGENDTAGFDPMFYFHHCFVDRMFWLWQLKHNQINELSISPEFSHYAGTNNFDSQGPPAGKAAGDWLTLSTPLDPFVKKDGSIMTSLDVINIETQLGYTYGAGSFTTKDGHLEAPNTGDLNQQPSPSPPSPPPVTMAVSGLNRGAIQGSFVISVTTKVDGREVLLGTESVLSRRHTSGCANCQTHLNVKAYVPMPGFKDADDLNNRDVIVRVHTRDKPEGAKKGDWKGLRTVPLIRKPVERAESVEPGDSMEE